MYHEKIFSFSFVKFNRANKYTDFPKDGKFLIRFFVCYFYKTLSKKMQLTPNFLQLFAQCFSANLPQIMFPLDLTRRKYNDCT